jgi:predicted helicase
MAGKARLLEHTLYQSLISDEKSDDNSDLRAQFETFKGVLIHDLTPADFADIYAQTLAYGMFAARLHDDTLDTFSRQEAAELIPKTNPFLRKLFFHVAGIDIDPRIKTTVDNLADVFRATDVAAILKNFGKTTQTQDPIIHFYETFLAEYNPKLRKQRGVWYTPEPVVQFIVRAVDDILKSEFDLADGIADTSKIQIEKQTQTPDSRTKTGYKMVKELVHKVQILDPATGTGTFLAAIIQHIFHSQFENMGGIWSSYVEQDLLPRLHGFELLMASYAMAHLKLDMLLADTGYEPIKPKRLQVYLTNSLEEHNPDTGTLFAGWLSAEANEANAIKRDAPVMVVMGNPPYAVSSTNKGEWIQGLVADYKKDLNERKINLDDDYIKFIRYGQHYIEKNGEGILAFITNNSFIDGITHRQMRKSLMETFDKIHILDLHGNSNRQETTPNGGKDENVFDIRQGVSINIFIKNAKKDECKVYVADIYGLREEKYDYLEENSISSIDWTLLEVDDEYCFFSEKSLNNDKYMNEISLSDLFKTFGTGIETKCDDITVAYTLEEMSNVVHDFKELSSDALLAKYKRKNSKGWCYEDAKKDVLSFEGSNIVRSVSYRPFDKRYTVYTGNSSGIMGRPRFEIMKNLFDNNLSLTSTRSRRNDASCYLISDTIVDKSVTSSLDNNYVFPLYLYTDPKEDNQNKLLDSDDQDRPARTPNLDPEIVADIAKAIGLTFTNEKTDDAGTFAPIDILDYIYAVLHSPTYRETYKEFLKIDFPRVPYPSDADTFWQLVALGSELRQIHLLESPKLAAQTKALGIGYPVGGENTVTRKMTKTSIGFEPDEVDSSIGKVWLNDTQYFTNVPLVAWEFYIGGYQPAQKWLKDRQGRTLDISDVKHYMNIIAALSLTNVLMQRIDKIDVVG